MTDQTTRQTEACPACGQLAPPTGVCCGFMASEEDGLIPVTAEVVIGHSGEHVPIRSRWLRIGRDDANQIVIKDDFYASRYHAWVTFEQERFWVEDLGSTNGTLLNGEPLERRELLASGDKIRIGETELTFLLLEKAMENGSAV